jgi:branched-chain amino acid transport system permease protein
MMDESSKINLAEPIKQGLLAGLISLSVSVIGMVELFGRRDLIAGVLTVGQVLIFAAPAALAYLAASSNPKDQKRTALMCGGIVGITTAIPLIILIILADAFNLREFLINVSPTLIEILTFGQGIATGSVLLLIVSTAIGLSSAAIFLIPDKYRRPLLHGLLGTFIVAMFSEILSERVRSFFGPAFLQIIFRSKALLPIPAVLVFLSVVGLSAIWAARGDGIRARLDNLPESQQTRLRWGKRVAGILFLIILPLLLGTYLSEVANNVGIFVLMGLGLNIVVGFAGLLDLGYVAFFAIGAYTMGALTSTGELGIGGFSFWTALPICVLVSVFAGIILGLPVLRMRGDYLAIVTLGFGEIIRILAGSDLLKPLIGGAQGLLKIPKPALGNFSLIQPGQLYFVILAGVLLAAFLSLRLSQARLGRQWMAMREDEDVAEAMGINLVSTKLLAFAIGAAFSGLSGAIFASKLTSIFPNSFKLETSILVLSLIIVGGLGSLPGVIVGSIILVGLPEVLREFGEFRLLMYGALLVVMMLAKPEGFVPSEVRKRELHAHEEMVAAGGTGGGAD